MIIIGVLQQPNDNTKNKKKQRRKRNKREKSFTYLMNTLYTVV